MVAWVKGHELSFTFLATLALGLLFVALAAFTVSATLGLLATGVCFLAGGHWVTYLRTARAGALR
jgi:hypothetical protein